MKVPYLPPRIPSVTSVFFSPWSEMILSLHVLQRPDHHPYRVQWAQDTLKRLPPNLRSDLDELGRLCDEWLGMLNFEDTGGTGFRTVQEGISQLDGRQDAEFVYLAANDDHNQLSAIIEALQKRQSAAHSEHPITGRAAKLLEQPKLTRRRFVEFLQDYGELIFSPEWERIEPWLVRGGKQFREALNTNPAEVFSTLHPRLFIQEKAIAAQKTTLYTFPYEDIRRVVVRASTFVYPHLLIDWKQLQGKLEIPLAVKVPSFSRSEAVPPDLVRVLKALADPTRLQIVRLLHSQPHCTQQLAPVLSISEAAVSKQLKLLAEAGLVLAERSGNFVFYSLQEHETEMLMVYLRQFIEQ
jgi:DNA-binding transcriptional ArsR family regulator